jgi:hypothetical protein
MTGTLGANAVWDWMPFMAGLNGEEGPHAHRNPAHGVERHPIVGLLEPSQPPGGI